MTGKISGDLKGWRASTIARILNIDVVTVKKLKTGELSLDDIKPQSVKITIDVASSSTDDAEDNDVLNL